MVQLIISHILPTTNNTIISHMSSTTNNTIISHNLLKECLQMQTKLDKDCNLYHKLALLTKNPKLWNAPAAKWILLQLWTMKVEIQLIYGEELYVVYLYVVVLLCAVVLPFMETAAWIKIIIAQLVDLTLSENIDHYLIAEI